MKIFSLLLIIYFFQAFNAFAEVKFSNYKDIKITKKKFKLIEISKDLNSPWGMTFIDNENFLITEKTGKLLPIDKKKRSEKKRCRPNPEKKRFWTSNSSFLTAGKEERCESFFCGLAPQVHLSVSAFNCCFDVLVHMYVGILAGMLPFS